MFFILLQFGLDVINLTMNKTSAIPIAKKPNWIIALGIPFLVFFSCLLITFASKFRLNKELLSNGILVDLLITAPLIYFLAIRKTSVSKLTITRVLLWDCYLQVLY